MRVELEDRDGRESGRDEGWSVQRPDLWCGVVLILFGLCAAFFMAGRDIADTQVLVILLLAAGSVEAFAGILDHRAGGRTAAMDILLGLLSIAVGLVLLAPAWGSASSLVYLITIWLVARGLLDLVGSALMRSEIIQDARMIRAAVDLVLGLLSWIALMVVPWWELLVGWPESSVGVIRTMAGLSVVAAGLFLVAESRVRLSRSGAAASTEADREQSPASGSIDAT